MPELPDRPNLDQLRRQARELLRAAARGESDAVARLGAVSGRVTLSAAQLAVAREYGCQSWPALKAETERRRLSQPARNPPSPGGDEQEPAGALGESWSFGGATAIETSAGVLFPAAVIAGRGHATLYVSLLPGGGPSSPRQAVPASPSRNLLAHRPWRRRLPWAGRPGRGHFDAAMTALEVVTSAGEMTVVDDRGVRYALHPQGGLGQIRAVRRPAGPMSVLFGLDPGRA